MVNIFSYLIFNWLNLLGVLILKSLRNIHQEYIHFIWVPSSESYTRTGMPLSLMKLLNSCEGETRICPLSPFLSFEKERKNSLIMYRIISVAISSILLPYLRGSLSSGSIHSRYGEVFQISRIRIYAGCSDSFNKKLTMNAIKFYNRR